MKDNKKNNKLNWVFKITFITFTISIIMSIITSNMTKSVNLYVAGLVLVFMILIGIIFDIIGIAVTAADETPFHSLAAKKSKGAKRAIKFLRNADKMSSICNDAVGDMAGIISGATAAVIVTHLVETFNIQRDIIPTVILTAVVSAVTVGGKAFGKTIAIKNANNIIYGVCKFIEFFDFKNK